MDENILRNFAIDGSDLNVQDIVSKLRFISKLKPCEKLNVATLTITGGRWFDLHRFRNESESRDKTLEFIKKVVDDALEITSRCFINRSKFAHYIGRMILESLQESKDGIHSLEKTYEVDRMFVSRIEAFERIMNAKIDGINEQYSSLFPEESKKLLPTSNVISDNISKSSNALPKVDSKLCLDVLPSIIEDYPITPSVEPKLDTLEKDGQSTLESETSNKIPDVSSPSHGLDTTADSSVIIKDEKESTEDIFGNIYG
jgi:hypothetical protein